MASIAAQMRKLGLVTDAQAHQEEARRNLEAEAVSRRNRAKSNSVQESDLHGCKNVREFRNTARQFLLQDSSEIQTVIHAAHGYDNRRLVGQLYGLRNNLHNSPAAKHAQLINRALRGAGRRHNRDI